MSAIKRVALHMDSSCWDDDPTWLSYFPGGWSASRGLFPITLEAWNLEIDGNSASAQKRQQQGVHQNHPKPTKWRSQHKSTKGGPVDPLILPDPRVRSAGEMDETRWPLPQVEGPSTGGMKNSIDSISIPDTTHGRLCWNWLLLIHHLNMNQLQTSSIDTCTDLLCPLQTWTNRGSSIRALRKGCPKGQRLWGDFSDFPEALGNGTWGSCS